MASTAHPSVKSVREATAAKAIAKTLRGQRRWTPIGPKLQLTAMIDVVFLLLIYFVVTASFARGEGILTANLPSNPPPGMPTPPQTWRVVVSPVGTHQYRLRVERSRTSPRSFKELASELSRIRSLPGVDASAEVGGAMVTISPQSGVRWQHVLNAFNAAIKAGWKNVTIEAMSEP